MSKANLVLLVQDEGGRVSGFVFGLPTKAVRFGEAVIGVNDELEIPGPVFILEELLGMGLEVGGGAGIHHKHLGARCIEFGGVADEIVYLACAERTLISGPAAQDHEHHRPFGSKLL